MAVNPKNHLNLLVASQLYGSGPDVLGTYVSFDGGATWHDNGPLPAPRGANSGDDVTVAFDQQGTGYVAAMMDEATARGPARVDRGLYVWRTADGGRTFDAPVAVVRHHFLDHPWIATGAGSAYQSTIYAVWTTQNHAGLGFSRSTDSGSHFSSARVISTPAGGVSAPIVTTGPSGAVYAAFLTSRRGANAPAGRDASSYRAGRARVIARRSGPDANAEVVASADEGQHFAPARVVSASPSTIGPVPGLSLTTQPYLAADPRSRTVYAAYVAEDASGQTNVLLSRSADGAQSWERPSSIAPREPHEVYFQPQVIVDSEGGIDVTFFVLDGGLVTLDYARSTTGGASFAVHPATDAAFAGRRGIHTRKAGAWWIGDYQGLAVAPGVLYPVWNDTRTGRLEIFAASIPLAVG